MYFLTKPTDESGSVLIGTIIVLVAVTVIGVTLATISGFELDMVGSEKCKEEARYNSESCIVAGSKLIKMVLEEAKDEGNLGIPQGDMRILGITYASPPQVAATVEGDFAMKIMQPENVDAVCQDFTLTPPVAPNLTAGANILAGGTQANKGTAANVQMGGYSYGIGLGGASGGGLSNWFTLACNGGACNQNGRHITYARYKRVLGPAKGL